MDKPLGVGGEGKVHKIIAPHSEQNNCIKIYTKPTKEREDKLKYIIKNAPPDITDISDGNVTNGTYIICWPTYLVYNNNKFIGFIMPLAFVNSITLEELCDISIRKTLQNANTWSDKFLRTNRTGLINRLKLCYN